MFILKALLFSAVCACAYSQAHRPNTTPVPILKQINKQNDDGSYSFGYEAADGSFKIETKYPSGDVAGKYGYVDETGNVREVSYGAGSQRGFEPQGTGIMVPPPTLNDPQQTNALADGQEDDGQYREDPRIYEDPKYNGRTAPRPSNSFNNKQPARQSFESSFQSQDYEPQPQQTYEPRPQTYQPAYQQTYQPQSHQYQSSPQRSLFSQQTNLFNQAPQQFQQTTQPRFNQDFRPQSQIYHQQPQFSYQSYTPSQQYQNYQPQNYQASNAQNYQAPNAQNYNPFAGHPAQNFDPNTGSYSINF